MVVHGNITTKPKEKFRLFKKFRARRSLKQIIVDLIDKDEEIKSKMEIQEKEIVKQLLSPWTIRLVLVTLFSLLTAAIIDLVSGEGDLEALFTILSIAAAPFMLIYFFKTVIDDYQGRVQEERERGDSFELKYNEEKLSRKADQDKHDLVVVGIKNVHNIKDIQLQGALDLKDQEINTLRKYPEILLKGDE